MKSLALSPRAGFEKKITQAIQLFEKSKVKFFRASIEINSVFGYLKIGEQEISYPNRLYEILKSLPEVDAVKITIH